MDGATQTLNELLAPVMKPLGVTDPWFLVTCALGVLFLLVFILFVSRCVKIGRLNKLIVEKDDQITGLNAIAALRPLDSSPDAPGQSVVYQSTAELSRAAAAGGAIAGAAGTTLASSDAAARQPDSEESAFDDAWRLENTDFMKRYETGTLHSAGDDKPSRGITDAIFGGASQEEAPLSRTAGGADPALQHAAAGGQASSLQGMPEPLEEHANPLLAKIRDMELASQASAPERSESGEDAPAANAPAGAPASVEPSESAGRDDRLSGRIPRL